jgi:hypothetical protein
MRVVALGLCLLCSVSLLAGADFTASLKPGKPDIKFAGALAFGPDGVLFVADSLGSAIYAIDTQDRTPSKGPGEVDIGNLDVQIAAMLGSSRDQLLLNDMAVNPISKNIYLSLSRGRGPGGEPVIVRVEPAGKIFILSLDNVKYSRTILNDTRSIRYRGGWRLEAITDIALVDDHLYVAGLSNEEFSSNLRVIPFPFAPEAARGTGVEIYHGSHGRWETNAPVRTFVPYKTKQTEYILAAYTCTPLVKLPVSSLKPGARAKGTTIADFGGGNRPLDMVVYKKDGHDYVLMSSTARSVMKLGLDDLDAYESISSDVSNLDTDVPYETIADLRNVEQLAGFDEMRAIIITVTQNGSLELKTIALP